MFNSKGERSLADVEPNPLYVCSHLRRVYSDRWSGNSLADHIGDNKKLKSKKIRPHEPIFKRKILSKQFFSDDLIGDVLKCCKQLWERPNDGRY